VKQTFIEQPYNSSGLPSSFGMCLREALTSSDYTDGIFCVAFATSSGTSRLFGFIDEFVKRGGRLEALLGVRNGVTSKQAAEQLIQAKADVYGFDTELSVLFHSKIYILEGAKKAWIAVGSSNLTCDGLFRNVEANTVFELDLGVALDRAFLTSIKNSLAYFKTYTESYFRIKEDDIDRCCADGLLLDEDKNPKRHSSTAQKKSLRGKSRIFSVPPAPPPFPGLQVRSKKAAPLKAKTPIPTPAPAPILIGNHFAMTLSHFDCSHRTGVPGTPEMSLPESVVNFFPPVQASGRKYQDSYFDALLNTPTGTLIVNYRIWQRPGGVSSGHPDWRIRVSHNTIDLTNIAGNDIILFEHLPVGSNPEYEVWIIPTTDPTYPSILSRCANTAQASGQGGVKQYGIF